MVPVTIEIYGVLAFLWFVCVYLSCDFSQIVDHFIFRLWALFFATCYL